MSPGSDDIVDIVDLLAESGVQTRRERAAFVARLRDENKLSFVEIGQQLNVSPQRAQQLYALNRLFRRSEHSPFALLSTRARHFLDKVARHVGLPEDWEQNPAMVNNLIHSLRTMRRVEAFKFRQLGDRTLSEIENFMREKGIGFMEGLEHTGLPEDDMQKIVDRLNRSGWIGHFKAWPKGTYPGEDSKCEFTLTLGDFMGDAWEEGWRSLRDIGLFISGLGYYYVLSGGAGCPLVLHFYRNEDAG